VLSGQQDIEVFAEYLDGGSHRIPNEEITFSSGNPLVAYFDGDATGPGDSTITDITNSAGRASTDNLDTLECLSEQTSVSITATSGPFAGSAQLTLQATAPTSTFNCVDNGDGATATCTSTATTPAGTTISDYEWDCDGTVTNDSDLTSETCDFGGPGTFPVTHTVSNNASCDSSLQQSFTVAAGSPVALFTIDNTANNGTADLDATGSFQAAGTINSYSWTVPVGAVVTPSLTDSQPTVDFGALSPGPHSVTLTVTNNFGKSDSLTQSVLVSATPTATFTWSNTDNDGTISNFDASGSSVPAGSTTTITSYSWTFTNGNPGVGASATPGSVDWGTFGPGPHNVTVMVTNNFGETDSDTQAVTVSAPPTALANVSDTSGAGPLNCQLTITDNGSTSSGTTTLTTWAWTFTANPSVTVTGSALTNPGVVTFPSGTTDVDVDLTVTNNFGETDSITTINQTVGTCL
jgi:hypothetical protein